MNFELQNDLDIQNVIQSANQQDIRFQIIK